MKMKANFAEQNMTFKFGDEDQSVDMTTLQKASNSNNQTAMLSFFQESLPETVIVEDEEVQTIKQTEDGQSTDNILFAKHSDKTKFYQPEELDLMDNSEAMRQII
jgi:hypothetical protein